MKKAILAIALIAFLSVPAAFAQWQVDIGADVPIYVGLTGSMVDDVAGEALQYIIPFPNASISYNFDFGLLNLGVGAKMYSFIVLNVLSPMVYLEADLDPVVVNLSAWGGGFLVFGLANKFLSESFIVPDLSVMFKLGKVFRIGPGVMTVIALSEKQDAFPFLLYGSVKFRIPL